MESLTAAMDIAKLMMRIGRISEQMFAKMGNPMEASRSDADEKLGKRTDTRISDGN